MSDLKKEKCCQGCKNGQPGQNKACQAKLLMKQLEQQKEVLNKRSTVETDV